MSPKKSTALLVLGLSCAFSQAAAPTRVAAKEAAKEDVTFAEHVAPIIFNSCASCHRPGEAAPFPLTSYQEVKARGRLIATTTASGRMPPWKAERATTNSRTHGA